MDSSTALAAPYGLWPGLPSKEVVEENNIITSRGNPVQIFSINKLPAIDFPKKTKQKRP